VRAHDPSRLLLILSGGCVYCGAAKRRLTLGGLGSIGDKPAAAIADGVPVDMFASFCTGREDGSDPATPH
jgi:hypothetical protein